MGRRRCGRRSLWKTAVRIRASGLGWKDRWKEGEKEGKKEDPASQVRVRVQCSLPEILLPGRVELTRGADGGHGRSVTTQCLNTVRCNFLMCAMEVSGDKQTTWQGSIDPEWTWWRFDGPPAYAYARVDKLQR